MSTRSLRLHHRMVIPVVLVAVATTALGAFVSLSLVRRALEARVAAQLESATVAISRSDFALNQSILERVKEVAGAEVLTYSLDGTVEASTMNRTDAANLIAAVMADRTIASAPLTETVVRQMPCAGAPCYVAYKRLPESPQIVVAMIEQTTELSAATQAMTRTIVASAVLGLVVLALVGQVVARRVTGPLDRLVAFTRRIVEGGADERAPVGDDEIGRLAAAFNDMLDRLDRAQVTAVRSEKLAVTGLLAARVAHDIRNPLSSLKMQAQLLRSRVPAAEGQDMLRGVLHDVEQVESVVQGLLELAKPGDVALEPAQVNAVVGQVLDHLSLQLAHQRINVARDLDPGIQPVLLDVPRFKQALLNVLANAAEAMPHGGSLSVSTALRGDGAALILNVCDDGTGVEPSMLDRVFDPFVSTKRTGVGLGLVNTKAIVESHGGSVRLAPRSPKGTCVTIALPVVKTAPGTPTHV